MVRLGTLSASWLASKGHRHDIIDEVSTLTKGFYRFSFNNQHRVLRVIQKKIFLIFSPVFLYFSFGGLPQ